MLKNDIVWPKHRQFRSKTDWEPLGFFSDCLCNSKNFDLMLGFFSSTAIRTLSDGFATFLYNGGQMRLIINNILSAKDKETVESGLKEDNHSYFDLSNLKLLRETLSAHDEHFFDCLAWLISNQKIDIIAIEPKGTSGISHTKSGLFYDGIETVGFNGSCNFTKTALIENIESIDAYCEWDGDIMIAKIANSKKLFDKTFNNEDDTVSYIDASAIISYIQSNFKTKTISQLLSEEKDLIEKDIENPFGLGNDSLRPTLKRALRGAKEIVTKALAEIENKIMEPKFPYTLGPRAYQIKAYENWCNNSYQGLFAMATGTGKTITSLNCILEEYRKDGIYRAIILVPTISLVEQWYNECMSFNFRNKVFRISSKTNWMDSLEALYTLQILGNKVSFILISTYASFVRPKFQKEFFKLPSDTIFIADEAHNMGAPSILKLLKHINLSKRIGLSATPERQYDDEINNKLKIFFNEDKRDTYTYEYNMWKAINEEPTALCRFRYYPQVVTLTEGEFSNYVTLTLQIAQLSEPRTPEKNELFKKLCLKRQRIVHKAENKLPVFKEILRKEYEDRGNLRYTLVYTPEGLEDEGLDYSKKDSIIETESDKKLIVQYTKAVSETGLRVSVKQFTGDTQSNDRVELLKKFASGEIEVLTSMKCLDEGVDVPRAEMAIFCSSTGNPRQFIQRRGRVLRKHPKKKEAIIYDLVVLPIVSGDMKLYSYEKNEISKELKRIKDFAILSDNYYYSLEVLKPILDYYNLIL